MTFETLFDLIQHWSWQRGLDHASSDKQLIKLTEELGELCQGHAKQDEDKVKDSIGDMLVVLTIYCQQEGLSMHDCLEGAWLTIANRKGKTVDGVFIKEEDLHGESRTKDSDTCS